MIRAICRPRHGDVVLVRDGGERFIVPEADALSLADALRAAAGMRAFANGLAGAELTESDIPY